MPEATETIETTPTKHQWSRNNPYYATVTENRLLTGPGSEKETRHIEIDLGDSGIQYLPGDSAGVLPVNTCDAVDDVISRLRTSGGMVNSTLRSSSVPTTGVRKRNSILCRPRPLILRE